MDKRVVLKIGPGSIETGYAAAVQIGEEGTTPQVETQARLLPAPDLPGLYRRWQQSYWQLGSAYRIKAHQGVTNVSAVSDIEHCRTLSRQLCDRVHQWLIEPSFRAIHEKVLEQLNPKDRVRILFQTEDPLLQRMPWYELQFFERYRQAEVGICSADYQQVSYAGTRSNQVRVLAVLGNGAGLDTQTDLALLNNLDADIHFLQEPNRETFNRCLWDEKGWDILFFAGHSRSGEGCLEGGGEMFLNATDKLTIPQLKHALKKAIDRGLNTAIFNSCDGLGLAADLSDLHIPQVLVMREPVPDKIAHAFLQGFLESFSAGIPFYLAVREAREKLQGLEARFPCATWLPVIVQNMAETPPTWLSLQGKAEPSKESALPAQAADYPARSLVRKPAHSRGQRIRAALGCSIVAATAILIGRQLGFLEDWELQAYDQFLRLRPPEAADSRLLIITNTEDDIIKFNKSEANSSMSEETLLRLLDELTPLKPQIIGLDIYRDYAAKDPALKEKLENTDSIVGICKIPDDTEDAPGRKPPPELTLKPELIHDRVGANDFAYKDDPKKRVRRQLMYLRPVIGFNCPGYTFSSVIAGRYLREVHDGANIDGDEGTIADHPFHPIREEETSFGGYHNLNTQGLQTMLNYRIASNAQGCGSVIQETPADCLTVSEVLEEGGTDSLDIAGKIVLIGTTDTTYGDAWRTPYTRTDSDEDKVPGVFLQAQMISQLISAVDETPRPFFNTWPEQTERLWVASWTLVGGLVGAFSYSLLGWRLWLRLMMAEGLLLLACWLYLEPKAVWIPWVPGAIALPTAAVSTQIVLQLTSDDEGMRKKLAE